MKKLYVHTIGCQMNVYDSEQIAGRLADLGYRPVRRPDRADLIVLNTCSVREKAEQKAFSFLGRLAALKKRNPKMVIAVGGCVAQQEGARILERVPHVDAVFGTQAIPRLSDILHIVESERRRVVDTGCAADADLFPAGAAPDAGVKTVSGFVTIMRGCDNFCTYCIVPFVRGREKSRRPDRIVAEVEKLVAAGVKEVTLLGQNVNSYGKKEGLCSFPELLEMIDDIDGLLRIRFTTSHPKDLSDDLIGSFSKLDKLCRHIHLPVQSGSDRLLKRMNRKYDRNGYMEKVDRLRAACPDIAITSDFIVGFPGETEADFADTLDLVERIGFDASFAFKYSDRPNAPAVRFGDKVSESIKSERLARLLTLQERITVEKNGEMVGTAQTVLVEGLSKKNGGSSETEALLHDQWTGRTSTNKIINFNCNGAAANDAPACAHLVGRLLDVDITAAYAHSLKGNLQSTGYSKEDQSCCMR